MRVRKTPADIASALERRPSRRLAHAANRLAERLIGRGGASRLPHALTWRLRERAWRTPPLLRIYPGQGGFRAGPQVLLVGNDLSRSGAPQVLAEVALLLAPDHAVTLLSPEDGPWREPLVQAGIAVIVDPWLRGVDAPLLQALRGAADVVICNTMETAAAVSVLAPSTPTIWYFHETGMLHDRLAESASLRSTLATPARVWAVSHAGQQALAPFRPCAVVVRYGFRSLSTGAEQAPGTGKRITIGVFGSIEPRKGQDLLLDALALLDEGVAAQLRVLCHGRVLDAEFHAALRARAATLPGVTIGDALAADDYADVLRACDAIIVPSRDEPMSIVASDALGAGRVVLCSRACGISDFLEDGATGFVAASPEPASLAALLTEAVRRRAEWPAIALRGQQTFERHFSLSVFNDKIRDELSGIEQQRVWQAKSRIEVARRSPEKLAP